MEQQRERQAEFHRFFSLRSTIFQAMLTSGDSVANAYAILYAIGRGSAGILQGLIVSVRELGTAILQPIWGYLSDQYGRRQFVVIGLTLQAICFGILMPLATTPVLILGVFIIQTLMGTMFLPAWNGWLGDFTTRKTRGKFLGKLGLIGSWTSLFTLFFVTTYMQILDPKRADIDTYAIAFRFGGFFYLMAAFVALAIPQATRYKSKKIVSDTIVTPSGSRHWMHFRVSKARSLVTNLRPEFKRLILVEAIFRFAWASAWPIFPYATLSATDDWIQLAVLQIATGITAGLSQLIGGRLSDNIGRKRVIVWSRSILITPPILMALSVIYDNPLYILATNILVGLMLGAGIIAINSLILDLAPVGQEGTYFSLHLMVMGVVSFAGSLSMGFVLFLLAPDVAPSSQLIASILFFVAIFRFISWIAYFFVKEPYIST